MIRNRRAFGAVMAALMISLVMTGTVSAAQKSTNVLNVWGTMGVWGTNTNFFAQWKVTQDRADGMTFWVIDDLELSALVQNGKNCSSEICTNWSFGATAQFLNAAGQVVTSLTPPTGACYSAAYSSNSLHFSRCGWTSGHNVSLTATKIKFSWTVSVQRRDGFWLQAWTATKTVPIS